MFTSVRRRHGLKEKINTDKRSTLLCPKLRDAEHVFDGTILAPELALDGEEGGVGRQRKLFTDRYDEELFLYERAYTPCVRARCASAITEGIHICVRRKPKIRGLK